MIEQRTSAKPAASWPSKLLRGAGRVLWGGGKRTYALALATLVLWLSWKAFYYLVSALILPAAPPAQITDIQTRLDVRSLERAGASFAGVRAAQNPRTPLSQYHRLEPWYQPDLNNGCTRIGCHAPLPHGKNKADRAFLNMHATSLHCDVCHRLPEREPLQLVWYSLETGEPRNPPDLLEAYGWLSTRVQGAGPGSFNRADQHEIVSRLRKAALEAGGDPVLAQLAEHLAAVRVESEEFLRLLAVARDIVAERFRGEYGAKLALKETATGKPRLGNAADDPAVAEYLEKKDLLSPEERDRLLKAIHPSKRDPMLQCSQCHSVEASLVNLAAVGYPSARLEAIIRPTVMQAIESMREGRPFHIPGFLAPTGPSPSPE